MKNLAQLNPHAICIETCKDIETPTKSPHFHLSSP